jgi:hypothetical protein
MTIDNLAERLARVAPAYKDAATEAPSMFDPPPDGEYQTLIHEFDFFEGGQPKQAYLKMRFQVQHHPEHTGRFAETIYSLEDAERIGFLKADMARLVGSERAEQLNYAVDVLPGSAFLESLLDVPVLIRVKTGTKINQKTGKPYVGVYIQQVLGEQQRPQTDPPPWDEPKSDVSDDTSDFDATRKAEQEAARDAKYGESIPLEDDPENDEQARQKLIDAGCVCEDPLEPGGNVECPVPGHADF